MTYWKDDEPEVLTEDPTHSWYALRITGNSMVAPKGHSYPPGCLVYVDPNRCDPLSGDRVIARLDDPGRTTFKVFMEAGDKRWLMPLNPSHPSLHECFTVLGTVVGKWEEG